MNHKINMSQGAVNLLRSIVSGNGWAKTIQDIMLGGGLMVKLPEYANIPTEDKKAKEWAEIKEAEFEVTEKERDSIKKAIAHFVELGAIPTNKGAVELLTAFGYAPE